MGVENNFFVLKVIVATCKKNERRLWFILHSPLGLVGCLLRRIPILHRIEIVFQLSYDFVYAQRIFNAYHQPSRLAQCMHRGGKLLFKSYIYGILSFLIFFRLGNLLLKHLFRLQGKSHKKSFRFTVPSESLASVIHTPLWRQHISSWSLLDVGATELSYK